MKRLAFLPLVFLLACAPNRGDEYMKSVAEGRRAYTAGRFAEVGEIAALACWLGTEECSFSTGGVFDVSGGRATY